LVSPFPPPLLEWHSDVLSCRLCTRSALEKQNSLRFAHSPRSFYPNSHDALQGSPPCSVVSLKIIMITLGMIMHYHDKPPQSSLLNALESTSLRKNCSQSQIKYRPPMADHYFLFRMEEPMEKGQYFVRLEQWEQYHGCRVYNSLGISILYRCTVWAICSYGAAAHCTTGACLETIAGHYRTNP
jgi:hypothetical protein